MSVEIKSKSARYIEQYHKNQRAAASRWYGLALPDPVLLLVFLVLIVIGIIMVSSTSMITAEGEHKDTFYYINRHITFVILGLFASYIAFSIPVRYYERYGKYLIWFGILLLALLYMVPSLGIKGGGATRWISLGGIKVQPSEIVKLGMLLYAAHVFYSLRLEIQNNHVPSSILVLIGGFLPLPFLIKQPDFGSALLIGSTFFALLILARFNRRFLWFIFIIGLIIFVILMLEPYRFRRFVSFLNPLDDRYGVGFQLINSLIAISNGGLTGLGLGNSIQKHAYVPEMHNDFIFSIIAEEWGFLGAIFVLGLFLTILWRCFEMAARAQAVRRHFVSYYAYGVGILMCIQALIHIGVNIGSLPTKGLTLPLVSYGGSSMVVTCVMLAILLRMDAEVRAQAIRENKL